MVSGLLLGIFLWVGRKITALSPIKIKDQRIMGTKRLLYIPLPPDGTHHSNWQEATLPFLKLFYFLLCWIRTHRDDWYLLLYTLGYSFFFQKCIYSRGWPFLIPTKNTPCPPSPSFHTDTETTIFSSGRESPIWLTNGILWLIEFSGQLKLNLFVSSYPHFLMRLAQCTHICYMTWDLLGHRVIFPNVRAHWVVFWTQIKNI